MEITLSWDKFKQVVNAKKLFVQYEESDMGIYRIWTEDGTTTYETTIKKNASSDANFIGDSSAEEEKQADFEANYVAEANRSVVVAASATQSWFEGKTIEMDEADPSGICEWEYPDPSGVFLNKICAVPVDAEFGDYVNLTMHVAAGPYEGVQVGQYADHIYMVNNQPGGMWFYGNGAGKIPYGVKVRCTYNKVGSNARKFIIIAEFLR